MRRAFFKQLLIALFLVGLMPIFAFAQNAPAPAPAASVAPSVAPSAALPVAATTTTRQGADTANPVVLIIVIGLLALAPFGLIMMTSFVKIAVVLSILRNALGTQQVPPNQVITGISLILTIFIMSPVAEKMYAEAGTINNTEAIFSEVSVKTLFEASKKAKEPLRQFMIRYTDERYRVLFRDLAQQMAAKNGNDPNEINADDFRVVIPSFVTDQLTEAFQIGFILFIPFLIIDMVVANILQAMGMFMLSPTIISLPFKLLLFVLISGWEIIIKNLVLGYI